MADKFRNIYRTESTRLQNWDYGSNAAYFVTICTAGRDYYFGSIENNGKNMVHHVSEIGNIAQKYWLEIPNHFPYVELENFIIMPNHVHGIIVINKLNNWQNRKNPNIRRSAINRASTDNAPKMETRGGITGEKNPMLNENLSRIIRWYKGRVTFESRKILAGFAWQSRFYDHIIRNGKSFQNIQKYIQENPQKWETDKLNLV